MKINTNMPLFVLDFDFDLVLVLAAQLPLTATNAWFISDMETETICSLFRNLKQIIIALFISVYSFETRLVVICLIFYSES